MTYYIVTYYLTPHTLLLGFDRHTRTSCRGLKRQVSETPSQHYVDFRTSGCVVSHERSKQVGRVLHEARAWKRR